MIRQDGSRQNRNRPGADFGGTTMQLPENKQQKVKNAFFYLKDSFRFHDVGVPYFVQIIFVTMLAILFAGYVLSLPYAEEMNRVSIIIMTKLQEIAGAGDPNTADVSGVVTPDIAERMIAALGGFVGLMLIAKVIVQALSLFYAYVWHLKRVTPGMPFSLAAQGFLKVLFRLALNNLLFYGALVLAGVAMTVSFAVIGMLLPPLALLLVSLLPILFFIATSVFAFRDMSVMVGNAGVLRAFRAAWRLTNGCRRAVLSNMMLMYIIGMAVSWVAVGISSQTLVATFAASFFEVLLLLVTQRLIVRMYEDARGLVIKESHPPKATE